MEKAYMLVIVIGFIFGAVVGRLITKVKVALIYESELRKKRAMAKELEGWLKLNRR